MRVAASKRACSSRSRQWQRRAPFPGTTSMPVPKHIAQVSCDIEGATPPTSPTTSRSEVLSETAVRREWASFAAMTLLLLARGVDHREGQLAYLRRVFGQQAPARF